MAKMTLKVTEEGKVFYPINWSFLYLGSSRVYDTFEEPVVGKIWNEIESFDDEDFTHNNRINEEVERLQKLGNKVEKVKWGK